MGAGSPRSADWKLPGARGVCLTLAMDAVQISGMLEQSASNHPFLNPFRPGGDRLLGGTQSIAMATGGINVEFDWDFGVFQSQGVEEGGFDPNAVIGCHHHERWRGSLVEF